jgi:hypothetical protein
MMALPVRGRLLLGFKVFDWLSKFCMSAVLWATPSPATGGYGVLESCFNVYKQDFILRRKLTVSVCVGLGALRAYDGCFFSSRRAFCVIMLVAI